MTIEFAHEPNGVWRQFQKLTLLPTAAVLCFQKQVFGMHFVAKYLQLPFQRFIMKLRIAIIAFSYLFLQIFPIFLASFVSAKINSSLYCSSFVVKCLAGKSLFSLSNLVIFS